MFSRYIDNTYAPVVRKNLDRLIWGRLFSNACYRFAPPFIAVIARGLDVSVAQMGVALMIGEFAGLGSPILGRMVDKGNRVVSMTVGMIGITLAVVGAATSTTLVQFAISMFVMSGAKVLAAMGVATAIFSWRAGFAVGAIAMAISASFILSALPRHEAHAPVSDAVRGTIPRSGYLVFVLSFCLMGASQCISITFGPWFEDEFGFSSAGLIAVIIALGVFELVSSVGSARVTDTWGKEISVRRGAVLMVVATIVMAACTQLSFVAVPMLIIFILGFEFAIVSMLPLAANIVPTSGGIGLGLTVGAGTCGRAIFSTVATSLYDSVGPIAPALAAAGLSGVAALLVTIYARSER